MSIILKQPVTGPAAWTGKDIQNDTSWIEQLQASDIQALDEALATLKSKGRYLRQYLELGCDIKGVPLSKVEMEALDCFDRIMHSPEIRVDMLMEPGDLQFANNYAVLHSRTEFEDHDDVTQRRRMLRLWLKMPNARELAPEFPGRNGFPMPTAA